VEQCFISGDALGGVDDGAAFEKVGELGDCALILVLDAKGLFELREDRLDWHLRHRHRSFEIDA